MRETDRKIDIEREREIDRGMQSETLKMTLGKTRLKDMRQIVMRQVLYVGISQGKECGREDRGWPCLILSAGMRGVLSGWMGDWVGGCTDGRIDGWMAGWMDGWVDG